MKRHLPSRDFLSKMFRIAGPVSLQSLIAASLGIVDQMMIGQLGDTSIAAVGFGGRLPFIYMMVVFGITSGTSIYASQYYGKDDLDAMPKVVATSLHLGFMATVPFMILSYLFPQLVLTLFTNDPEVIAGGTLYLTWAAIGFPFLLLSQVFSAVLRSTHRMRLPLAAGMVSFFMNTLLNYCLIFGRFGFPELGIQGAALATALSRAAESLLLIVFIYWKQMPGRLSFRSFIHIDRTFVTAFLVTSMPLLINEFLWATGESVYSAIYGHIGTIEAAAMTMTYPIQTFAIAFFVGVSTASGIMLGNAIGAGDEDRAYDHAMNFVQIGVIGAMTVGIMIWLLSPLYASSFNVSDSTAMYFNALISVFAIMLFVKVSNMIIGGGILRSGGKTRLTLYLDMIGGWCIGIPLGLLTSRLLNMPVHYVYFFICLEEVFRLVVGYRWVRQRVWLQKLV